jgi:Flp pilus assembly protein TadG
VLTRLVRRGLARLQSERRGLASVEFALIAPVLLLVICGGFDAANAMMTWRRVNAAAAQIVKIASEAAVQADQTTTLTPTQVTQSASAIYAVLPVVPSGSWVAISSVVFAGTPTNCVPGVTCTSYTANVAWSVPYGDLTQYRHCGTLTQVAPGQVTTLTTLPTANVTALTSVLVVDVSVPFTPTFTRVFTHGFTIHASAILPPRISGVSAYVQFDTSANSHVCQGYV